MKYTLPVTSRPALVVGISVGIVTLLLGGCSKEEEPQVIDAARPVKTAVVGGPETGGERKFPGRVDSAAKAELAFRINGTVEVVHVREGDIVEEGQVLVELDPTDYEIVLQDRQATHDRTKNDFDRAKELVKDGFISRTDYDTKEAEFKNAEAGLQAAKQDMIYTKLVAPFGGTVAERYVERAEEVQAKQPVLAIHDEEQLEVKVDVPEGILTRIDRGADPDARDDIPIWATFEAAPDQRVDLRFKEVSTRADAATQTFQVTFLMDPPEGISVLPGMTTSVTADLGAVTTTDARFYLPVSAVTADAGLDPFVWVIDEAAMTVAKTPVVVGRMSGWNIEVVSGVEPGLRIVTAGVGYLAEGMKVRQMQQREQARPRPDEAPNPIVPEVEEEVEKAEKKAEAEAETGAATPAPEAKTDS